MSSAATAIEEYLNEFSATYQVYEPIEIGASKLTRATYTFTLKLTNFLGLSSFETVIVDVSSDPNVPVLTIIGPSYQTITASSQLNILSTATLSSCASKATTVAYTWTVVLDSTTLSLASTSKDPRKFLLASYSLDVDKTYEIIITATAGTSSSSASVTVYVAHGDVTAVVAGGYTRSTPIDKLLALDASASTDSDESPTAVSTLAYEVGAAVITVFFFANICM
jgi:hypothetical protein